MKLKLIALSAALAAFATAQAAEPAKPSCCAETKPAPATPSCCAAAKPDAAALLAPLSTRSLYQLDATWTNDDGAPVKLATLRGQPVVLTMFFASCEYACPMLIADMQRLRQALPEDVRAKTRFVLVSFDTERDTAPALHAYRQSRALDSSWTLLRGDNESVQELAMLLGVKFKQDARGQFSHSNIMTVLNAEGEIAVQRAGLQGDVLEPARAIALAAKP